MGKLKIVRIKEGAFLDDEAMELLAKIAEKDDYQIWIERVIPHDPVAVIMEDGHQK